MGKYKDIYNDLTLNLTADGFEHTNAILYGNKEAYPKPMKHKAKKSLPIYKLHEIMKDMQ